MIGAASRATICGHARATLRSLCLAFGVVCASATAAAAADPSPAEANPDEFARVAYTMTLMGPGIAAACDRFIPGYADIFDNTLTMFSMMNAAAIARGKSLAADDDLRQAGWDHRKEIQAALDKNLAALAAQPRDQARSSCSSLMMFYSAEHKRR